MLLYEGATYERHYIMRNRINLIIKMLVVIALYCVSWNATAFCFSQAGARYSIDPLLLKAIAKHESNLVPTAINYNKDSKGRVISVDYGVMQVNSTHIPELKREGIIQSKDDLIKNPCLNVQIGAWILAKHLRQCGVNWMCLGSYNAGFNANNDKKRMVYAKRIYFLYLESLSIRTGA